MPFRSGCGKCKKKKDKKKKNKTFLFLPGARYRAAGVIPYFRKGAETWFLLGRERRRKEVVWSDFGGKIEEQDGQEPEITAIREFHEEAPFMKEFKTIQEGDPIVWNASGKQVSFFMHVDCVRVNAAEVLSGEEKSGYAWVKGKKKRFASINQFLKILIGVEMFERSQSRTNRVLEGYDSPEDELCTTQVALFSFFCSTLRTYGLEASILKN
jgi:hypothetical protein